MIHSVYSEVEIEKYARTRTTGDPRMMPGKISGGYDFLEKFSRVG